MFVTRPINDYEKHQSISNETNSSTLVLKITLVYLQYVTESAYRKRGNFQWPNLCIGIIAFGLRVKFYLFGFKSSTGVNSFVYISINTGRETIQLLFIWVPFPFKLTLIVYYITGFTTPFIRRNQEWSHILLKIINEQSWEDHACM